MSVLLMALTLKTSAFSSESISGSQPVDASISAGDPVCEGQSGEVIVTLLGEAPWTVVLSVDGILLEFQASVSLVSIPVEINGTADVCLMQVTDAVEQSIVFNDFCVQVLENPLPDVSYIQNPSQVSVAGEGVPLSGGSPEGGVYSGEGVADGVFYPTNTGTGVFDVTYTYTNENGCTASAQSVIEVVNLPSVQISGSGEICYGDLAFLSMEITGAGPWFVTGSNGMDDFTLEVNSSPFNWQAFPLTNTTYCLLEVTDALGGTVVFNDMCLEVVVHPLPEILIAAIPDASVCVGEELILAAEGAQEYEWTGGILQGVAFVPDQSNVYSVEGTDEHGCAANASINVTVHELPEVLYAQFPGLVCLSDPAFQLTEGFPFGGSYSGAGVQGDDFDPAAAGLGLHYITYSYTDKNGCTGSSVSSVEVETCPGISEEWLTSLSIYPNPAENVLIVESSAHPSAVRLLDSTGRIVLQLVPASASVVLSMGVLNAGCYLLEVEFTNGDLIRRHVVKN